MTDMTQDPVRVRLEFQWQFLGQVQPAEDGRLLFPVAPRRPGLYRFRLQGKDPARHYVGETDELRRRFQHYRTPGPSQQTNIRMNGEFRDHMAGGGSIEVDIVIDKIDIVAGDEPIRVNLADKSMRRLLEHAALVDEAAAGAKLLNH